MNRFKKFILPLSMVGLLAVLASCAPSYLNTEDLGAKATAQEIRDHYAGKSVRYSTKPGGKADIESYFAADGTYKLVALDGSPFFATGTWRATDSATPAMQIRAQDYIVENGRTDTRSGNPVSFWVYIQPDGSVEADMIGGGNFSQPKPTPGFQAAARYNELRRQAGL